MADHNQSHHFGQPVRPPIPTQGITNQPAGHGTGFQGVPKMAGILPPSTHGQGFQGGPPHGLMNTSPSVGQGPPQRFSSRPVGLPPPVGGNVNGFVPPASQGLIQQRPVAVSRPPGPPGSTSAAPLQPVGNFRPPMPGQFVPSSSSHNSAPPSGSGLLVNGTLNAPPAGNSVQTLNHLSSQFQPLPLSQSGPNAGPSQPSVLPSQTSSCSAGTVTGSAAMTALSPASGSSGSQSASISNASCASTPSSGPPKPPSQKSSRGPSPVSGQSYDALEGQFSPVQAHQQVPGLTTGSHPAPQVSQAPFPPMPTQRMQMPPPPRPSIPGAQGPNTAPPLMGSNPTAAAPPFGQQHVNPPASQYPGSMPSPAGSFSPTGVPTQRPPGMSPGPPRPSFHQAGPPGRMPGLPSGPSSSLPGPPSSRLPAPPSTLSGPPPTLPGPPTGFPGPYMRPPSSVPGPPPTGPPSSMAGPPSGFGGAQMGPPSGPTAGPGRPFPGPPTGPFNLGPPTSGQGPASSSGYPHPPTAPHGMVRPPAGPPSGPVGPPSGPLGPPSAPYSQSQFSQGQGYPQPAVSHNAVSNMAGDFNRMGINDMQHTINLLQEKKLIADDGVETARPVLSQHTKRANCNPDVFRCTLNAIPQSSSLLNKSRLPLGILIHPFKDLSQLPVIQSSVIVRCRSCRTYINPFVTFVDQRRWKCNLCFRVNELPDEFSFDPVTKTYGDPQRRPEIKSATIEFIAPSEYMLRPPQPAVYLFVLDVSFNAVETGYLRLFTQTLVEELDRLPGDARTQVGFLCFDRALYFFNLSEGLSQPQMMVVPDLEDVFLPTPDNLLVNLHECRDMVVELLTQLPALFEGNHETGNALGTALQAAFKLMSATGGRVTVMQTTLPTVGPGALENREATSKAASLNSSNLGPASDFYKKLALDCSAQQVAVDLFMLNGQYADIASVSCISKYSAGSVQYYPSFHTARNPAMCDKFESDLRRYFTRKIGFESVMRIRCTRGVSIHTFHGNFFVRSTDLLSLPNINPDAGFGMQMSIEDNLSESSNVCFQAALLYTSSKGERRIRVHTLCVPTTNQLSDVFAGADQQAIAALLAKMAADRTVSSSLEDAREALMNACQDMLNAYAAQIRSSQRGGALVAPSSLRLFPLFTLSMLKSIAFRLSPNIKLDDRVYAHLVAKTMPVNYLLMTYYAHLYPVHALNDEDVIEHNEEKIPKAPRLQLSSANLDRHGVYVMDQGENVYLLVGSSVSDAFCQEVLDVPNFMSIPEGMVDLPELDNPTSDRVRRFINYLMDSRPGGISFLILRDDSKQRHLFFRYMVEDRTESSMSYYEFLQFVQQKVKG